MGSVPGALEVAKGKLIGRSPFDGDHMTQEARQLRQETKEGRRVHLLAR